MNAVQMSKNDNVEQRKRKLKYHFCLVSKCDLYGNLCDANLLKNAPSPSHQVNGV